MLQTLRQDFVPTLPSIFSDLSRVSFRAVPSVLQPKSHIVERFPLSFQPHFFEGFLAHKTERRPLKVGVVFSGGQASGGHNVITGLFDALKLLNPRSLLLGFLGGPSGIISGTYRELQAEELKSFRNQGGFDLIGSGRTKIESEEHLQASLSVALKLQLDGLVIIGGDDSNTNAAALAEFFLKQGCSTQVIGVPKTIDGDLKNPYVATSFGFDTACKVYAEMIGNIERDALSAKKYYHFIRLMGRSASHIALECALQTHPNLTLIGEEIAAHQKSLKQITQEIVDLICARAEKGKQHGVILFPEGLIEFIPEVSSLIKELNGHLNHSQLSLSEVQQKLSPQSQACFQQLPEAIQRQLLLTRDPHGNVQVSFIETERLFMEMVTTELAKKGKSISIVPHFFGYEGRAGFPSNFDCHYCYALGFTSAAILSAGLTGCMCAIQKLHLPPQQWQVGAVPLTLLMDLEFRKGKEKPVIKKALVDLQGKAFSQFSEKRELWKFEDHYVFPGPIQFYGDPSLSERTLYSIQFDQ